MISSKTHFEYIENDEEKTIPYPPMIFALSSCGQLCKYAIMERRPGLEETMVVEPAILPTELKRPLNIKPADGGAKTEVPPSKKETTSPFIKPVQKGSASINPEEERKIGEPIQQPGLQRNVSVAQPEGTYDAKLIQMKKRKEKLTERSQLIMNGFREIADKIRQIVLPKFADENRRFFHQYVDVEIELFHSKETLRSLKFFVLKGQDFQKRVQAVGDTLNEEAEHVEEIIKREILEGKEIKKYRNTVSIDSQ
jgi:hypothetical protein